MSDGRDAGRLLSFALTPKIRPGREPEYDALLRQYRMRSEFRALVDAVAEGLGLRVLHAGELGIVLAVEGDGPFALRLSDYRQNLSTEERVCHGLIQLAIAAWAFPTAAALEESDTATVPVTVIGLVRYLRDLCKALEARAVDDPELGTDELREAWRAVVARAETRATPDGRRVAASLVGMVQYALERLADEGLLRKVSDDEGGTFQTLTAYRVQVREMAALEAFALVRRFGRRN